MITPGPLNRAAPGLPAAAMKTYEVSAPVATHWRPATCQEVDCPNHLLGWRTTVDETTDLGQRQAALIRDMARPSDPRRRKFVESRDPMGLTVFTFEPGQACFAQHKAPLLRPPLLVVRDGDWRGNPRGTDERRHTRVEYWAEDFAEHQQKLADHQQRG